MTQTTRYPAGAEKHPAHLRPDTMPPPGPVSLLTDSICAPGALDHPFMLYAASTLLGCGWVPVVDRASIAEACFASVRRFMAAEDIRKQGLPYRMTRHAVTRLPVIGGIAHWLLKAKREYDARFASEVMVLYALAHLVLFNHGRYNDPDLQAPVQDAIRHVMEKKMTAVGRQNFLMKGRDMGTGTEADEEGHPDTWLMRACEWAGGAYKDPRGGHKPPIILSNNVLLYQVLEILTMNDSGGVKQAIRATLANNPDLFEDTTLLGLALAVLIKDGFAAQAETTFVERVNLQNVLDADTYTASLVIEAYTRLGTTGYRDFANTLRLKKGQQCATHGRMNRWLYSPAGHVSNDGGLLDLMGHHKLLRLNI